MVRQKLIFAGKWTILWLSGVLGILFWIVDSFIDVFIFLEGTLVSKLFTPGPYEIYVRFLTMGLLILFGAIVQSMVIKHKRAEELIRDTSSQWQITFDAVKDGIFIAEANGKILRCNKAFADFMNSEASKIVGRTCHEVVHGTADFMDGCPFITSKDTRHREVTELKAGNKWLYVTVDPILNNSGEVISFVHAISDITERK